MVKNKKNLPAINKYAAGIDIGSRKIFISVDGYEVRSFDTFTSSFKQAIAYLKENSITTVAMESTGVYWISLYEMLEAAGFEVCLVKSTMIKNVPGRKTDVKDCQWIQQLHTHGLLRSSFIPENSIRKLRSYVRLRRTNIRLGSDHIRRAQKALDLMNIKLHFVISDITGVSGLKILKAILNGETNADKLTSLCDAQILKTKKELVKESLEGNFREEHLFSLKQAVDGYEYCQQKVVECDKQIEKHLDEITSNLPEPARMTKAKRIKRNAPQIDKLHEKLLKLTNGKDPTQMKGFTDLSFLESISEVGINLKSHWSTEKYYTSWLGLAPNSHDSGQSSKKKRLKNKSVAGQIFRVAAQSLAKNKKSALGAFYRRISSKKGRLTAMKATARKLAVIFYNIMTEGIEYVEHGVQLYEEKMKERFIKKLRHQAKSYGFTLMPQLE